MILPLFIAFLLIHVSSACSTPGYEQLYRGKCFKSIGTCGNGQLDCHASVRAACAEDEAFPPLFEQEQDIAKINQMFPDINRKDSLIDPFCGNYDRIYKDYGDKRTCIKVFPKAMNWTDAEAFCKARGSNLAAIHSVQVNDYIRRSAIGHGFKTGIHVGLVNGFDGFKWTDGTHVDYSNYEHGYPNAVFGNCGMMNVAQGKWFNIDCASVAPFACTKPPLIDEPIPDYVCDDRDYKSGDHLYSPGFPMSAETMCDYALEAPEGKVVELEIVFLEANKCCDVLLLEDNTIGGKVIANLTGWSPEAKVYRSTSRYMWVHWQPRNGEGVRGFHGIFRTVSP